MSKPTSGRMQRMTDGDQDSGPEVLRDAHRAGEMTAIRTLQCDHSTVEGSGGGCMQSAPGRHCASPPAQHPRARAISKLAGPVRLFLPRHGMGKCWASWPRRIPMVGWVQSRPFQSSQGPRQGRARQWSRSMK
jgi:hypothetical protein